MTFNKQIIQKINQENALSKEIAFLLF